MKLFLSLAIFIALTETATASCTCVCQGSVAVPVCNNDQDIEPFCNDFACQNHQPQPDYYQNQMPSNPYGNPYQNTFRNPYGR